MQVYLHIAYTVLLILAGGYAGYAWGRKAQEKAHAILDRAKVSYDTFKKV